MDDQRVMRRRAGEWIQPALLEEEEVTLEVRATFVRGVPLVPISYTLTRPDGSWVACTVLPPSPDGGVFRRNLDRMIDEALTVVREVVPPF